MKNTFLLLSLVLPLQHLTANSICTNLIGPGYYLGSNNPVADPEDANDSMFCITGNDVMLDFAGRIVVQDPQNHVPGFNCITINPGLSNILITNGTIVGMTGLGISIGEGCRNIIIDNIKIIDCDATGILFDGNAGNPFQDIVIRNCYIYSCTGVNGNPAYGLHLTNGDNIIIENSKFNKNDASTLNDGYGASIESCTNCHLRNCETSANGGNNLGVGINIDNCEWVLIENSQAYENSSYAADPAQAIGILISTSSHVTVNNCNAWHTTNTLAQAYGFQAINGFNNSFNNCSASHNSGATTTAGFILQNETQSSLNQCESTLNDGTSGACYGILLDGTGYCFVTGNKVNNNTGTTAIGLEDTIVDSTNLVASTVAFNNTTNYQVSRTVGSFPVVTATLGDFSATTTAGAYININFIQ